MLLKWLGSNGCGPEPHGEPGYSSYFESSFTAETCSDPPEHNYVLPNTKTDVQHAREHVWWTCFNLPPAPQLRQRRSLSRWTPHSNGAHASIESSLSNYLPPIWSLLQPLLPKLRLFSLNLAMRGHRRLLHHKHALLRRARLSINGRPRGRVCGPLYSTCATAWVVLVMQPPQRSCSGRLSALTARDAWRATQTSKQ